MTQVDCEIPHGLRPGQEFRVESNGQTVAVTVPPGKSGGDMIRVAFPEGETQVANATDVAVVDGQRTYVEPVVARPAAAQEGLTMGNPRYVVATNVPPGAMPGGRWRRRPVPGCLTCCFAIIFFPIGLFAFLCPCDSVLVYEAPDGRMWIPHGAGYVVG